MKSYYLMDPLSRRWCLSMRNDILWGHIHCHIWSHQKSLWYWEAFRLWWWIHVFVDSDVGFRTFHFPWQQKLSVLSFDVTDLLPQFSRKQSATGSGLNSLCFLGQPYFEETLHEEEVQLSSNLTSWEFWFTQGTCLTVCHFYHTKY